MTSPRRSRPATGYRLLALAAVTAGLLAGCGSENSQSTSGPSATPASSGAVALVITIKSFKYSVPGSVPAGANITVINRDDTPHSVTADPGKLKGPRISFSDTVDAHNTSHFTAPRAAGRYPFHCKFHPDMHGVLVVK